MLSFGEQLYRLTQRDEETLLVDPFFVTINVTLIGATPNGTGQIAVPPDRSLFIHSFVAIGDGPTSGATGNWRSFALEAWTDITIPLGQITVFSVNSGSITVPLVGDGQVTAPAATASITIERQIGLILPPGIRTLTFPAATTAKTGDASARLAINGYLVPPGRIGRR